MKIGEARKAYAAQLKTQRDQKYSLIKQQEEYRKKLEQPKISGKEGNTAGDSHPGVTLELSEEYKKIMELQEQIDGLSKQIEKNEKGLDAILEMENGIINSESAKQQGDAVKEYAEDMAKCLEIARRISKGDKVPASDEKKLMDFNMEVYMAAKNMAVMNMDKERKEWESLWGDEEEKEYADPIETAANTEIDIAMPEGMETAPVEEASGGSG